MKQTVIAKTVRLVAISIVAIKTKEGDSHSRFTPSE